MMPEMDGFTFLERVEAIPTLARVPIVVLTAKDLTEAERRVVERAHAAGADQGRAAALLARLGARRHRAASRRKKWRNDQIHVH